MGDDLMRLVQSKNSVHGLLHFSSFFLSSYALKGSFYLGCGCRVPSIKASALQGLSRWDRAIWGVMVACCSFGTSASI